MLAFLRRLIGGVSGGATSTRGMSTAAGSVEERLYACLFPGERYSPGQAAQLAGRLREVAQSLVVDAEKQPEEPASKKRKKEQRGRGAPPPPLPPPLHLPDALSWHRLSLPRLPPHRQQARIWTSRPTSSAMWL